MRKMVALLLVLLLSMSTASAVAMQIFVRMLNGKTITLEVGPCDPIRMVKEKIEEKDGIAVAQQQLIFAGELLEDNCSLAGYDIRWGSTLLLLTKLGITVTVRLPGGTTMSVNVQSSDTVADVKKKLAEETGIPAAKQSLIYKGVVLSDSDTMGNLNVTSGDEFILYMLPATGDASHPIMWCALALMAAAGAVWMLRRKKMS